MQENGGLHKSFEKNNGIKKAHAAGSMGFKISI
jgi:hypothetical protein